MEAQQNSHTNSRQNSRRLDEGFSLVEFMIVMAITGILAAVVVPNFISYRDHSRVTTAVETAGSIRAALSAFAANDTDNNYPMTVYATYEALKAVVNPLGASLPDNAANVGIASVFYQPVADALGNDGASYTLTITTLAPASMMGHSLIITPEGITRAKGPSSEH